MEQRQVAAQRFAFIDSVRGIAALSVACFHFYNQLWKTDSPPLWGWLPHVVMRHGDLGVFVFFVLSGFVIACSLHRVRIDGKVVAKFAARRSLRLDPAYWTTIFLTSGLMALLSAMHAANVSPPTFKELLANMFYLDNLLKMHSIVKVGWTLCLEIQFYLVFVLLGWIACRAGGASPRVWLRGLVFLPLAIYSVLVYADALPFSVTETFVPYWFMYFLGVVVWWSISQEVPRAWLWLALLVCGAVAVQSDSIEATTALATASLIAWAAWSGRMDTLLASRPLRYLGRVSYSVYLVHPLVGTNFLRTVQRVWFGNEQIGPLTAMLLFAMAMAVSIAAAHLLYRLIEAPSHRLSRRIRWSPAAPDSATETPIAAVAGAASLFLPPPLDVAASPSRTAYQQAAPASLAMATTRPDLALQPAGAVLAISSEVASSVSTVELPRMAERDSATRVADNEFSAGPGAAAGRSWGISWRMVVSALGEFLDFCRRQPTWAVAMALFTLVWTAELYFVQRMTLVYPNLNGPRFEFWAPKIRLLIDLLFILSLTVWIRRRLLVGIVMGSFVVCLVLVTYYQYFFRPLSLLTVFSNWREGLQLGGVGFELFPKVACLALAAALVVKLVAIYVSRGAALPRSTAWVVGPLLALTCISLEGATNLIDPLYKIQSKRGIGRLGAIRGYLGPWLAEWYYLGDSQVLQQALAQRNLRYDRLTPIEADIPIHDRLVILQAESLDFNILGYEVDGVPVTPFLNGLRSQSMFYRVRAVHNLGSADADFVALTGVPGSVHQNTYVIPGYPYQDTTPQLLARCGYVTDSFHGQSGEFYSRRPAFEQMGLDEIFFREELEGRYGLPTDRWGVFDRELLMFSSLKMRQTTKPTCHFVITLTTHAPYNFLPAQDLEIFKDPRTPHEQYVNNMRYLDNCLRDYVTSLGRGTTVMIYADHPTEVSGHDFKPDREVGTAREFIPCFIYDSDQDLSKLQKTRKLPISRDGSLNLVDMIKYLRAQVTRQCRPNNERPAEATAEPASVP